MTNNRIEFAPAKWELDLAGSAAHFGTLVLNIVTTSQKSFLHTPVVSRFNTLHQSATSRAPRMRRFV